MKTTNETRILEALEVEISKSKKRLDDVYANVESLKRDKLILEGDSERIAKYNTYLETLGVEKQKEVKLKEETLKSLDIQIEDKTVKCNKLQHEISKFETSLDEKRKEFETLELQSKKLRVNMSEESAKISEDQKLISELKDKLETKLRRIHRLVEEIK